MANTWFYIDNNQRVGPIDEQSFYNLLNSQVITDTTYVWRKGLENWTQVFNIPELMDYLRKKSVPDTPENIKVDANWFNTDPNDRLFFIKQSPTATLFGPYSLGMIKILKKDHRINDESWIFSSHMLRWISISMIPQYEIIFDSPAPTTLPDQKIQLFGTILAHFQKSDQTPQMGLVQDLSVGGLQVITKHSSLPLKSTLVLTLRPLFKTPPLVVPVQVVRVLDENSGLFVRFTDLSSSNLQQLQQYIDLSS